MKQREFLTAESPQAIEHVKRFIAGTEVYWNSLDSNIVEWSKLSEQKRGQCRTGFDGNIAIEAGLRPLLRFQEGGMELFKWEAVDAMYGLSVVAESRPLHLGVGVVLARRSQEKFGTRWLRIDELVISGGRRAVTTIRRRAKYKGRFADDNGAQRTRIRTRAAAETESPLTSDGLGVALASAELLIQKYVSLSLRQT